MFDYHMHTRVSYDSDADPKQMAEQALNAGLKEICFTDHLDYGDSPEGIKLTFETEDYNAAYDQLTVPGIEIRRGMEFGMLPDNQNVLRKDLLRRPFDFVLGSVHFVDGIDIYYESYWQNRDPKEAEKRYFECVLECVRAHDDFDVLGHLTYIGKIRANPARRPIPAGEYAEIVDEILRILAKKGKGIEVNTSGFDRCGVFLPNVDYLRRFKELGGEIVTVGSDAHDKSRVGQYCREACEQVADIFGCVCTFVNRKPIFHKI